MYQKLILASSALMLLTACQPEVKPEAKPDPALAILAKASTEIKENFDLMARLEQGMKSAPAYPSKPKDPRLNKAINLPYWNGPIEQSLETVAALIGYKLVIIGKKLPNDIPISIQSNNETAFDVLRNIGYQASPDADVSVDVGQSEIHLIYQNAQNRKR